MNELNKSVLFKNKYFQGLLIFIGIIALLGVGISVSKNTQVEKEIQKLKEELDELDFKNSRIILNKSKELNIKGSNDKFKFVLDDYFIKYKNDYTNKTLEFETYFNFIHLINEYGAGPSDISFLDVEQKKLEDSYRKEVYDESLNLYTEKNYIGCINKLNASKLNLEKKGDELKEKAFLGFKKECIDKSNEYIKENEFENAKDILNDYLLINNDTDISNKLNDIEEKKSDYNIAQEEIRKIEEANKKEEQAYKIVYEDMKSSNYTLEIIKEGIHKIKGLDYYVFSTLLDDAQGDAISIISISELEHFRYYVDGSMYKYGEESIVDTTPNNTYIDMSIAELNKSSDKYFLKQVKLQGKIKFIKEDNFEGSLILMDDNGQKVHVKYLGNVPFNLNDYITLTGVVGENCNHTTQMGIPIVLPCISSSENEIFYKN